MSVDVLLSLRIGRRPFNHTREEGRLTITRAILIHFFGEQSVDLSTSHSTTCMKERERKREREREKREKEREVIGERERRNSTREDEEAAENSERRQTQICP